jgi:hypothetical protein
MHLHNCRHSLKHLRMLLQILKVLCKAPGGAGTIWKYLEALVRATIVSGRFACSFWTDLHFATVACHMIRLLESEDYTLSGMSNGMTIVNSLSISGVETSSKAWDG